MSISIYVDIRSMMSPTHRFTKIITRYGIALGVAVGVGCAGIILLRSSNANTPTTSVEVERGQLTTAQVINDSTASGGSAIKFAGVSSESLLWSGSASNGFNAWASKARLPEGSSINSATTTGNYSINTVNDPLGQRGKVWRFEVRDNDYLSILSSGERAQLGMGNPFRTGYPVGGPLIEGSERWYYLEALFDKNYPFGGWQTLFAFSPPPDRFPIAGGGGMMRFIMNSDGRLGSSSSVNTTAPWPWKSKNPVPRGITWVRLKIHVKFSADPSKGGFEVWYDDTGGKAGDPYPEHFPFYARQTLDTDSKGTIPSYERMGIYRDPVFTATGIAYYNGPFVALTDAGLNR